MSQPTICNFQAQAGEHQSTFFTHPVPWAHKSHEWWLKQHPQWHLCILQRLGWLPVLQKTLPLEHQIPGAHDPPRSPLGLCVAGTPVQSYCGHSQVTSHGCQAAWGWAWRLCLQGALCECWLPSGTGCWSCESRLWARSHIYGCHMVASFSSPGMGSNGSTASSPQPEPKPQEIWCASDRMKQILQPCHRDACLDFTSSHSQWLSFFFELFNYIFPLTFKQPSRWLLFLENTKFRV